MKKLTTIAMLLAVATGFAAERNNSVRLSEKNLLLRSNSDQHCLNLKRPNITIRTRDSLLEVSLPGSGETSADLQLKKEWKYLMIELEMQTGNVIPGKKFWQPGANPQEKKMDDRMRQLWNPPATDTKE